MLKPELATAGGSVPVRDEKPVPLQALLTSLLALIVSGIASFVWPESLETLSGFVWLLALVPSFLLAYHKGWQGAATGLAGAMALLVIVQVTTVQVTGQEIDWRVTGGTTVVLISVSLGAGWYAQAFRRQRELALDMARVDALTGLPNRRTIQEELSRHFALADGGGAELSVVMFDIDGFKDFNDRYGHQAGDEALRVVGGVLRNAVRRSDVCGRYGGEEFLVILPGQGEREAYGFAERVRQAVEGRTTPGGQSLTISAGVASLHPSMAGAKELVEAGDRALYAAKARGRNQVVLKRVLR